MSPMNILLILPATSSRLSLRRRRDEVSKDNGHTLGPLRRTVHWQQGTKVTYVASIGTCSTTASRVTTAQCGVKTSEVHSM